MTNDTTGDWVNAITAERAAYQREYLRGGHGTYKEESIKAAHARTCSRIIAQAYRAGGLPGHVACALKSHTQRHVRLRHNH